MSSTSLDDLDSRFKPLALELIDRAKAVGLDPLVVCTLRGESEQRMAVKLRVSWTLKSKHLAQPPEGKSLAIDLCPKALLLKKSWDPSNSAWWTLARLGIELGLRSGADWDNKGLPPVGITRPKWDPGHFEFVLPTEPPLKVA